MKVYLALFAAVGALLFYWLKRSKGYWLRRGIPHDKPSLIEGNMVGWRKEFHISQIFRETYNKFKGVGGPFAGFYFLFIKTIIVTDIELVKSILIKDFANFNERGIFHNERDDPLTGNLFFLDGEKWKRLRQKLTPTFTSGKMKHMFATVLHIGQELSAVFADNVGEAAKSVEVTDLLARYTADVIGSCAFGIECNSLRNPSAEFVEIGKSFFIQQRHSAFIDGIIQSFPNVSRRLHMRVIHQSVHDFYMRIVRDTVEYREKNNVKRNDFMDMLIELKNNPDPTGGLTVEEVAAQAFVFFIASFETSSTTMGFVLYELARCPDAQNRLRAEIREVLARHKGEFSYECMKEMEYLNQVIDETLRLHPALPHLIRRTRNRYETGDPKYYIDKNTLVIIPSIGIHHDPEYYPDPEKFMPERFTADEVKKRPACTYLPFGEGPRNCIGIRFGKMQACIGLVNLITNFIFTLAPETQVPYKLVKKSFLLNSENGIHLRVEKI